MKRLLLLLILPALVPGLPAQSAFPTGRWDAWLDCPGGPLSFGLSVDTADGKLSAWVINGTERIPVTRLEWAEDVVLTFEHYDSRIVARINKEKERLDGTWSKVRGVNKVVRMPFHAVWGRRRPETESEVSGVPGTVSGRFRVRFSSSEPAVGVFKAEGDGDGPCTGTFLTPLGDYRYLAGYVRRGFLRLSCFDGAHAFLFHARRQEDGTLKGDFWSSNTWHETWTATPDETADLADPWKATRWTGKARLEDLAFPDLDGRMRSVNDPEFRGKARIIEVFGSWCPNCNDHGAYLARLHRRYRDRGLSVLGLAFELTGDHERDGRQVKRFARLHGVKFPILLAGVADKTKATETLKILDRVRSYPTTLFIDGKGVVRGVYQGFSGPATGPAHAELRKSFEGLIEEMLAESEKGQR